MDDSWLGRINEELVGGKEIKENFTCEMKRYCNFTQYNQCGSISLLNNLKLSNIF